MARDREPPPPLREAYPELFRKLRGEPAQSPRWREFWDSFLPIGVPLITVVVLVMLVFDWSLISWQFAAMLAATGVIARVAAAIRSRRQPPA